MSAINFGSAPVSSRISGCANWKRIAGWFSSGTIVLTATLAAASLIGLVVWELTRKEPIDLSEVVARAVGKMMVATCDFGSAAKSFRHHKIEVAGKTGTLATTTPFYMEHSWFVGYAPADQPQIVVSVLLGVRLMTVIGTLSIRRIEPTRAATATRSRP